MHKLNSRMHKSSLLGNEKNADSFADDDTIEHENRLAKVLAFHSKGFSQSEIAQKLNVDQSTVSRDLQEIRKKARGSLELYVNEEIPNEFQIYISGLNEIIKNLWGVVEDKKNNNIGTRDRTYVLSLLMQCYTKSIGGPESDMNARKQLDSIHHRERFPRI